MNILEATGTKLRKKDLLKEKEFIVTEFGTFSNKEPVNNTRIINNVIERAHLEGGGCVVFPKGEYKTYTIELKSNVNIRLDDGAVIKAARTNINHAYESQDGEGGNYLSPEVNHYVGLQDHGHSYFANSLFYACEQENIMIYGDGTIDGSYVDEKTGYLKYALMGGDPFEPDLRKDNGYNIEWFGNKGIALVRCRNVILTDFSFVIGGHFAIICEGVTELYVDNILVDTTRDAFDIDCCQNVTVVNSKFNSLTDDALVIKASYGAGLFMPSKNILIEDCVVSGYDAGSVYAGIYSREKLIATDSCGPTGRVKLGTESTCGYERVTVRRVKFDRSRGFSLEAVDGSDLTDVIFEDVVMDNVSSSPIFLRVGDRGRFPVTGISKEEKVIPSNDDIRIDNKNWILPALKGYRHYPPKRYTPAYKYDCEVSIDGKTSITIVNQEEPIIVNEVNASILQCEKEEKKYYGNASGSDHIACMSRIMIRNVVATNVDPRYPILIMGLMDSKISDVHFENIKVTYRGGLKKEHAVEQRQIFTNWEYKQYLTESEVQTLPWLVNPFFTKNEGLLPRVEWNIKNKAWIANPYNIPELPNVYPEPSNWGILPSFGMYIRHAKNVTLKNIELDTIIFDERDLLVMDDVDQISIMDLCSNNCNKISKVNNYYKRPTNKEYVKEEAYIHTDVTNLTVKRTTNNSISEKDIQHITINCPAPGTPHDSIYPYPTVATPETGYFYQTKTEEYSLPLTVYRPFFSMPRMITIPKGEKIIMPVILRVPSSEITMNNPSSFIYNEMKTRKEYIIQGQERSINIKVLGQMPGITYSEKEKNLILDSSKMVNQNCEISLIADDGIMTEVQKIEVHIV